MNDSKISRVAYLTRCKVAENSHVILSHFPNEKYESYRIAVLVINCILLFSTISLNGISVITIRKSSQLRNKVCYFVILLQSVVDLGVGILGIPIFIYYLLYPFLDTANCTLIVLAYRNTHLTCVLSMITLSAMTMERYIGVLHPYYYQAKVTKKRILIYVCGNGFALLAVIAYSFRDRRVIKIFGKELILVFFVFTAFVYTRIYLVIRKLIRSEQRSACEVDGNQSGVKRQIVRESRRARSCFLIIICFAIFLLPFALSRVFTVITVDVTVYRNWSITSILLNSSINSVIFFWTKTLLRKEALKTLKSLLRY